MNHMSDAPGIAVAFHLGPKGRSVLPVAVRRAAGLEEGTELVATALGDGRVLLETVDAVRQRVWAGAPALESEPDAAADVRRMRQEDIAVSDAAASRRATHRATSTADPGATLLSKLGL
jgi:bifunctional DNA-binding transcriptional regulator/antitoxin component of YhaV-PrlF toxin-antitoxin module